MGVKRRAVGHRPASLASDLQPDPAIDPGLQVGARHRVSLVGARHPAGQDEQQCCDGLIGQEGRRAHETTRTTRPPDVSRMEK